MRKPSSGHRPSVAMTPAQVAVETARKRSGGSDSSEVSQEDVESGKKRLVSTMKMLQKFESKQANEKYFERADRRRSSIATNITMKERRRALLSQLEKRAEYDAKPSSIPFFSSSLSAHKPPPLPEREDLVRLAQGVFPPRMSLKVHICDIYKTHSKHWTTTLAHIESCWKSKPSEVIIRWIAAPLGPGLCHSSVEGKKTYISCC